MLDKVRVGLLAFSAFALFAGLAAACGDDSSSDSGGTTATATTAKKVTVPAGAPLVDQDNLAFKPEKLTVKAGEAVYFKNSESAIHTVNVNGKNVSGNMKKDDVVTFTFDKAGEYKITCDYHPQMKATITAQ